MHMKQLILTAAVILIGGNMLAAEDFSDSFDAAQLSPAWTVHEGEWVVSDGELVNHQGGLITLNVPRGDRFALDARIYLPNKWLSVIFALTEPHNYDAVYFLGAGYWETFTMNGQSVDNYIQHRDADITTGVYHDVRIVYDYGRVTMYFDGELKGHATHFHRPGAAIGFRTLKGSGTVRIDHVNIETIDAPAVQVISAVSPRAFTAGAALRDHDLAASLPCDQTLAVDTATGEATLAYDFQSGDVFESRFVRVPVDSDACNGLVMEVEGDGSVNNFFIILHDADGEQHLAFRAPTAWRDWQTIEVDLKPYLQSPPDMQRLIVHWGGNENQKIDFPLTAVDIGIAKREARKADEGRIRFRNIRFVE
jgi:hypothetical protein